MKFKNKIFVFALIISLILSVGTIVAADDLSFDQSELKEVSMKPDNVNLDMLGHEDDEITLKTDDNFHSTLNVDSKTELLNADNAKDSASILSAQSELSNNSNYDEQLILEDNDDSLMLSNKEVNIYLDDIKTSTSDEFYKFVDYLIKQKGFKFNAKTSDDGYTIYSSSNYQSLLYDGEDYVLLAGNTYFISKNRTGYVIGNEYYPDILYSQNDNIYVDELYLGWLKNVENYHITLTIEGINSTITLSGESTDGVNTIVNGVPLVCGPAQGDSSLPSSYDLRNVNGQNYVTSIKDQANAGTCWIFASIAALESHLLKTEGKTYDYSINYDFSENNLKNVMSSLGRQGINRTVTDGGLVNFALAYFLRWSGPILDEFDKYVLDNKGDPINNIPIEFVNSAKHVQGVKYIHARNNATDNDEIKQAIMDYGGVVTSMWWIRDFNKYEIGENYYYDGNADEVDSKGKQINYGHEICIIGWNDTYSRTNFKKTPKGDGAFLIKNSWGSNNIGDEGYYWVSYYDTQLAMRAEYEINGCVGFSFTLVENNTNYGKNYNYNPLGVTEWRLFSNCDSYYSQWIAEDDETLKAVGVYVHDACECIFNVFVDGIKIDDATTNMNLRHAGFHTIALNNSVNVKKNQKFRIEVTISSNSPVYIPLEISWTKIGLYPRRSSNDYYFMESKNADESGIIVNNKKGHITNGDVCINVYTEYKDIVVSKMDIVSASYHDGFFEVQTKLLDSANILAKNFDFICDVELSSGINEYQYVKTNGYGEATLKFTNGVKIINNKLSISFAIYDAYTAPILRKTVEINVPKVIDGNIESISIGSCVSVDSVNIKGSVNSISIGSYANVKSIVIGRNLGVISISGYGVVGSISVSGNIQSISTSDWSFLDSVSTGDHGKIGTVSTSDESSIGSVSTGNYGNIGSVSTNDGSFLDSVSTGNYGNIGSVSTSDWSFLDSVSTGNYGNIGSVSTNDGSFLYSVSTGNYGNIGSVSTSDWSSLYSVSTGGFGKIGTVSTSDESSLYSVFIGDFGNIDSVSTSDWSGIVSVSIGDFGKIGTVSVSDGSFLYSVFIGDFGNIGSVSASGESFFGSVSIGDFGKIDTVSASDWSIFRSVSTGDFGNIGSVSASGESIFRSVSTGDFGNIGSVSASGWSHVDSISKGKYASIGSVSKCNWANIAGY